MVIDLQNNNVQIKSLINGKISQNIHSSDELYVLHLILDWIDGKQSFKFDTSGSTGQRKSVVLNRKQIQYSAEMTLNYLDPLKKYKTSLLCINPRFVGGTMVVIRAIIGKMKLYVQSPVSLPTINSQIDLTSMVPLQVESLIKHCFEKLSNIKTLIIGGAAISEKSLQMLGKLETLNTYTSYGMTETASHIGLRNVKHHSAFRLLGDIEAIIEDGKLTLQGTVTNHVKIYTNDIIEFNDEHGFQYKGRADNVINSGGYKVFPEEVESILSEHFDFPLFITGIVDEQLGEKVVLFAETNNNIILSDRIKEKLHRYQIPKEIYTIERFEYTTTGKIKRKPTLKKNGF